MCHVNVLEDMDNVTNAKGLNKIVLHNSKTRKNPIQVLFLFFN